MPPSQLCQYYLLGYNILKQRVFIITPIQELTLQFRWSTSAYTVINTRPKTTTLYCPFCLECEGVYIADHQMRSAYTITAYTTFRTYCCFLFSLASLSCALFLFGAITLKAATTIKKSKEMHAIIKCIYQKKKKKCIYQHKHIMSFFKPTSQVWDVRIIWRYHRKHR